MEPGEAEYATVIETTDRLIARGNPDEAAFWLGYRHGFKHHLLGIDSIVPAEDHRCFIEVAEHGHRDGFIDAYARGYQNGIDGRSFREILGEKGEISKQYLPSSQGKE